MKRRWESAWVWTFIVLGVASYYLYTVVPSGWQLMTMGFGALLVIVGLLGPYQFRVYREATRAEKGKCSRCGHGLSGVNGELIAVRSDRITLLACPKCGTWNGRNDSHAG